MKAGRGHPEQRLSARREDSLPQALYDAIKMEFFGILQSGPAGQGWFDRFPRFRFRTVSFMPPVRLEPYPLRGEPPMEVFMTIRAKQNEAPDKKTESSGCCCGNKRAASPAETGGQDPSATKDAATKHSQGCKSTG